jgi:pyruvate kinase
MGGVTAPNLVEAPKSKGMPRPGSTSTLLAANNEVNTSSGFKFKTKIVCTLGPVSREKATLKRMLRAGMNVARFNFSHGSHEYHQHTLDMLRAACKESGIHCAVLLDTKGPEIRTGLLENGEAVYLVQGEEVVLTTDYTVAGNKNLMAVSYPNLARDVAVGCKILCADGSITLTVLRCNAAEGTVVCRCDNNAKLGEKKNMNLPGVVVDLPTMTEKDQDDILNWGVMNDVDIIAPSFVRKGSDVTTIRNVLGEAGKNIQIISKVENNEGLDNFEDILRESDGIMVARGDLGMEIPMEKMFMVQKRMINLCNIAGKPVITATQMLESMCVNPRPTRAEVTDVANAVLDGTDCVMLSGETAAGPYPVDAVKVMASVSVEAEHYLDYNDLFHKLMAKMPVPMSTQESIASSSVRSAQKTDAKLIITLSRFGQTARLVAKYRPSVPVLMVVIPANHSPEARIQADRVCRSALCVRGVAPIVADKALQDSLPKEHMEQALAYAIKMGMVKDGDNVVGLHKVEGDPIMKIITVGNQ